MRRLRLSFAAAACAVALWPATVLADVEVTGDAHDLTVTADEASLEDVIVAVAEAVGSTIEPPDDLPDKTVTGVYRGSVGEVLKALVPKAGFIVAWRNGTAVVHFVVNGERPRSAKATRAQGSQEQGSEGQGGRTQGSQRRPDRTSGQGDSSEQDASDEEPGEPRGPWGNEPPQPARRIY